MKADIPIRQLSQQRTNAVQQNQSLDHLVGAREQHQRHVEAERLSGLEIDHKLAFLRQPEMY